MIEFEINPETTLSPLNVIIKIRELLERLYRNKALEEYAISLVTATETQDIEILEVQTRG
jgi:hypothetical protein